jgi:hypothetical protein
VPIEKCEVANEAEFQDDVDLGKIRKIDYSHWERGDEYTLLETIRKRKRYEAGLTLRFIKKDGRSISYGKAEYETIEKSLSEDHNSSKGKDKTSEEVFARIKESLSNADYDSLNKKSNTTTFRQIHEKLMEEFRKNDSIGKDIDILNEGISGTGVALVKRTNQFDIKLLPLQSLFILEKTYEDYEELGRFFGTLEQKGTQIDNKLQDAAYYFFGLFRGISTVPSTNIKEDTLLQFLIEKKAAKEYSNEMLYKINIDMEAFIREFEISPSVSPIVENKEYVQGLIDEVAATCFKVDGKPKNGLEELVKKINRLKNHPEIHSEINQLIESARS